MYEETPEGERIYLGVADQLESQGLNITYPASVPITWYQEKTQNIVFVMEENGKQFGTTMSTVTELMGARVDGKDLSMRPDEPEDLCKVKARCSKTTVAGKIFEYDATFLGVNNLRYGCMGHCPRRDPFRIKFYREGDSSHRNSRKEAHTLDQ